MPAVPSKTFCKASKEPPTPIIPLNIVQQFFLKTHNQKILKVLEIYVKKNRACAPVVFFFLLLNLSSNLENFYALLRLYKTQSFAFRTGLAFLSVPSKFRRVTYWLINKQTVIEKWGKNHLTTREYLTKQPSNQNQ